MSEVNQDLFLRIQKSVAEVMVIPIDQVSLESRYLEDLGATSVDMLTLLMFLEDEHGIELQVEEGQKLKTIKDTVLYLEKKLAGTV
ncbi:MAG: acyl carrier protein [Bdellovibrionota bacterium]